MRRHIGPPIVSRLLRHTVLEGAGIRDALLMGPNARRTAPSALNVMTSPLPVTFDLFILLARTRIIAPAQNGGRGGEGKASPASRKRNAGDAAALGEQLLLGFDIVRDRVRRTRALMIEIPARRSRQFDVASGEPRLGITPLLEIIRADGPPIFVATHPGSKALDRTSFQCRATANASRTSQSLLSA